MAQTASAYWRARRERDAARKARPVAPATEARCPACGGTVTRTGGYCTAPMTGPGACRRAYTD